MEKSDFVSRSDDKAEEMAEKVYIGIFGPVHGSLKETSAKISMAFIAAALRQSRAEGFKEGYKKREEDMLDCFRSINSSSETSLGKKGV